LDITPLFVYLFGIETENHSFKLAEAPAFDEEIRAISLPINFIPVFISLPRGPHNDCLYHRFQISRSPEKLV